MAKQSIRKVTLDHAIKVFNEAGCRLLAIEYPGNQLPMPYICECGNESSIRLADFIRGRRCQNCKSKKNTERLRKKDNDLASFCEQNGCLFIESFMQSGRSRIKYICKCGEPSEAYWTNYRRFPNCKKCGSKKIAGDKCHRWNPDRQAVEFAKKFRKRCGNALARCLKATGQDKVDRTSKMLGYTPQELQDHILGHAEYNVEMGMEFHIDHIFPVQAFLDYGIHDLQLINCLENLRPLPGKDNLSKADKFDEVKFLEWLKERNCPATPPN